MSRKSRNQRDLEYVLNVMSSFGNPIPEKIPLPVVLMVLLLHDNFYGYRGR
jgi:hypothetical protein